MDSKVINDHPIDFKLDILTVSKKKMDIKSFNFWLVSIKVTLLNSLNWS
jgi:hypothetical protein